MKRIYTIGRDESCDIIVYDASNFVSRHHATLRVDGHQFFLTDVSTNGTYRNGIRLVPNIEYPVNKKDVITFGNVITFDWNSVPKTGNKHSLGWLYILLAAILLLLAGTLYYFWPQIRGCKQDDSATFVTDSLLRAQPPAPEVKQDSLVVPKDVPAKKKSSKINTKDNTKTTTNPNMSQKTIKDYTDEDDSIVQDAL